MAKVTICAYPNSDHALPHWKCVFLCCAKCSCVNIPDQEKYDQYYDTRLSSRLHIYDLIARCTTHGRLLVYDKNNCRRCKHDCDTEQTTKYTL